MSKPTFIISAEAQNNKAVIRIDGIISEWNNHSLGFKNQLDNIIAAGITEAIIYINSGGGSCFEANEIVNELERFTGKKTASLGALCASAASYIACKCETVIAAKNISYMIHKPMMEASGNSDEIKSQLKLLENLQSNYAQTYSDKTGLTLSEIAEMWMQDYWMNAEQAKELGFIDSIEGEAELTPQDISEVKAFGYKNLPNLKATALPEKDLITPKLLSVLSLPENTNKQELITRIESLKMEAHKSDLLQEKIKLTEAKIEATNKFPLKIRIGEVLAKGKIEKKILHTQEEFFRKNLETNFDETKAIIESLPEVICLSSIIKSSGLGINQNNWSYEDYQNNDPKALRDLAINDEPKYKSLLKAHYGKDFD